MCTRHRRLTVLFPAIALAGLFAFSTDTLAQKARNETVVYTSPTVYASPTLDLVAEPTVVTARTGDATITPKVQLTARATLSSSQTPKYKWSVNGGHVEGHGANAEWDLSGLQPGYYKAFVEIDAGSDKEGCVAFSSTTVLVNPAPPVCPNILILCPDKVVLDQPLVFSAKVAGGSETAKPVYDWIVSAGKIIEGAGTSVIKVDTRGLAGQTVTATLSMSGYGLDCAVSCVIQIPVPKIPSRRFDQFPNIARNDEKARLDNLAIELQNDPTATAYVIVYPGRHGRPGEVSVHTKRIVDYLVNSRAISARRVVTVVGPPHEELMVELWITPQGATPPTPTP